MSTLDQRLVARCRQLRDELHQVERALPSIDEEIASQLGAADQAAAEFRQHPFRFHFGHSPELILRFVLGYSGVMQPERARQVIEEAVRASAGPWLRLPAAEREGRLVALKSELRRKEAALEQNRRQIEGVDGIMLPRDDGTDPSVWLAMDPDLAAIAEGKEVSA